LRLPFKYRVYGGAGKRLFTGLLNQHHDRSVMRLFLFLLLQLVVFLPISALAAQSARPRLMEVGSNATPRPVGSREDLLASYAMLPLYFMENRGQAPASVRYLERGAGHATFFTENAVVLALSRGRGHGPSERVGKIPPGPSATRTPTETLGFTFIGARKDASIEASDPLAGRVNYFRGSDRKGWKTDIPTYGSLVYRGIYRNIDIRFYGTNRDLEHDIVVHPGGDPGDVRFGIEGISALELMRSGDLALKLGRGRVIQKKPYIYQVINGKKVRVNGRYRIIARSGRAPAYGFEVAPYDRTADLIIDPVLVYSTYIGGASVDAGLGIAVDGTGAAYLAGYTISADFPLQNPIQGFGGFAYTDAFVTKMTPAGDALVYSTYLGGSLSDYGSDIAVDASGAVYISGSTSSTDYPLVSPIQAVHGGVVDVTVTKLNPAGNAIVYSTFLGGSDEDWALGMAIDSAGAAYLTGYVLSIDFPVLNAIQPAHGGGLLDAFVTKISPSGTAIVYSTYLGGTSGEHGNDIAVDSTGAAYVTGQTWSADFPLVAPIQAALSGADDTYITKIDPAGASITYSTLLGGTGDDAGNAIAVDAAGAAYVAGDTGSADFPVLNAAQAAYGGAVDGFVTKIAPTGAAIVYSTYLGGGGLDRAYGLAVDTGGNAYVTGQTFSADFPLVDPVQSVFGGNDDGFVTELGPGGSLFVYSTFLGGAASDNGFAITVDSSGQAHVTGFSYSTDFPLLGPFQGFNRGTADSFVTKIGAAALPPVTLLIRSGASTIKPGGRLVYTVTTTNTTATSQCFQYWENVTLPGGKTYPPTGELRGPLSSCLNAGSSLSRVLWHAIPGKAAPGAYVLNAFLGTAYPGVMQRSSLNFSITAAPVLPALGGQRESAANKGDRR